MGPTSRVAVAIGRADVHSLRRHAGHRAAQGQRQEGKAIAARAPQGTGPAKLRFKLAKLSTGFLSRRPDVRVRSTSRPSGRRQALSAQPPLRLAGASSSDHLHDNQLGW